MKSEGQMRLGVLFSSGKDSAYAAYLIKKQNCELTCLITLKSENPYSYMFHTPNIDIVDLQAEAMEIPLVKGNSKGDEELELKDLKATMKKAKEMYTLDGIVTGAIHSNYQRKRIEKICRDLDLAVFSPLWNMDQETEMRCLISDGFKFIFTSIAAYGLDASWLGKIITSYEVDKLVELNNKININIAGEGGEFESLVLDCPLFNKHLTIKEYEIKEIDDYTATMIINRAELTSK